MSFHWIPGDPASVILGPRATPELRADLNQRMGLDQPVPVQLGRFLGKLLKGDLGTDPFSNRQVADIVFEQLPFTLILVFTAIVAATLIGVPLGAFSAIRRDSWLDRFTAVLSVAFIAIPSFVIALYALLLLSVKLRWFPAIGAGETGNLADQARHLVLPAAALGLGWIGYIARLVRASMLEVMEENHIRNTLRQLRQDPLGFTGLLIVSVVLVITLLAPWLVPYDPNEVDVYNRLLSPSAAHWLGTDQLGRDILSRVLMGGQVALKVSLVAISVAMAIGVALGMLAGFGPRWLDRILVILFDTIRSFPTIMFALAVVSLVGSSLNTVTINGRIKHRITCCLPPLRPCRG